MGTVLSGTGLGHPSKKTYPQQNRPLLNKYNVIFFDAGGTLFHPDPSVGEIYREVASRHGGKGSAEEIEDVFRTVWKKHDGITALQGEINETKEKEWWRQIVREVFDEVCHVEDFDVFFDELYHVFGEPSAWKLYPETLEVLDHLRSQKKRLGIISNWDSRLFQLVRGLGVEDYFEFVLASAVFGSSKPNARIFEEALGRMGARPEEAVHIGDSMKDDIHGASGVGIEAIWVQRGQSSLGIGPNKVVTSLDQLIS